MIIILLFTLFFGWYIWEISKHWRNEPKGFPKGPRSLVPFFGGMISAGREPHKHFLALRKKYGNIFAFDVGTRRTIIINHWKETKVLGTMAEFSGRAIGDKAFLYFCAEQKPLGIIFSQMGPVWHEQRRFTMWHLRDFGFLKRPMECCLADEIRDCLDFLKSTEETPLTLDHELNSPIINSIWSILVGTKFGHNDPLLRDLQERISGDSLLMMILVYFPNFFKIHEWFPRLVPFVGRYINNRAHTFAYMKKLVDDHKVAWIKDQPRDFIDRYLDEIENETDPESSFYGNTGYLNLLTVTHDLFFGGSETASTSLKWALHIFALYPEVQEKTFLEIKSVVGLARQPSLKDRNSMPYMSAVYNEILRFVVLATLIPHVIVDDITYNGQFYPRGTPLLFNNYACLHDPEYWGDPEVFRPERFLTPDGSKLINHPPFIPFHFGKRICIGKTLAEDAIFLFITAIVQNFKVSPDPSRPIPTGIKSKFGATHNPISFPLIFQDRFGTVIF